MKQNPVELKEEIDKSTIIVRDFNISLSMIIRTLENTSNQFDLIVNDRTLQPTAAVCTFFSSVCRTFTKIDYALCHKTSVRKS